MTKQIRKNAPEGATHFRDVYGEILYYKVIGDSVFVSAFDGNVWIPAPTNVSDLHRLHAPEWVEPAILIAVTIIAATALLCKYLGWF